MSKKVRVKICGKVIRYHGNYGFKLLASSDSSCMALRQEAILYTVQNMFSFLFKRKQASVLPSNLIVIVYKYQSASMNATKSLIIPTHCNVLVCRLKRTSPTAYCDCWEKCKCRSLVAGSQTARLELLQRLLADTDLVQLPNQRGENILLFLVQTVGRQQLEQRQYRPARARAPPARKTPSAELGMDLVCYLQPIFSQLWEIFKWPASPYLQSPPAFCLIV